MGQLDSACTAPAAARGHGALVERAELLRGDVATAAAGTSTRPTRVRPAAAAVEAGLEVAQRRLDLALLAVALQVDSPPPTESKL
jgi:hypothetical protein